MRVFFAITLSDAARAAVTEIAGRLQRQLESRRTARAVRWVGRENLHVTLRFIGEIEDARVATLLACGREPLPVTAFRAVIGGGGCFPASGPPRVVWVGVRDGADDTRRVYEALDARLAPLGFEKDAGVYTPHLTLGRVRDIDRAGGRLLRDALSQVADALETIDVRAITLYRSHLSSTGPRYEALQEIPLS